MSDQGEHLTNKGTPESHLPDQPPGAPSDRKYSIVWIILAIMSIATSIAIVSTLVANKKTWIDDILNDEDYCNHEEIKYFKFSGLFMNLSFALFAKAQSALARKIRIVSDDDNAHFEIFSRPTPYLTLADKILVVLYLTLATTYFGLRQVEYTWCPATSGQLMREVHRQPIVYVANILVLCYARYNLRYHLHLETLFLVSAIYFFELLQRSLTDDSFDTFTIFIYFNVKVAVIIFQAFIDNYWYNVRNTEYVALGFFFFFGRILVQFYYTQAREYQPQNWDVVFWTGLTMEALACWRMFYILMLHNSLPDTRMSDVIGRNLRTNAADQQRNVLADTDSKGDDSKAPKIQNDEQVNVSAEKDSKGDGNKDSAIQCPASQRTADHVQEEVLYMAGKHIYFIFFANVSIAISCILSSIVVFQRDKYIDDLLDDYSSDNCNSDSRSYFGFAGIFMNLSFALLIHGQYIFASENYGFGRNFSSENAYELFKPWHCFLVVLYLCLQIFYFIVRAYDFTWCPNKYDQNGLILESIRGTVCYFLSSLVVIFGHYVTHGRTYMQLETLYLYTVVLFF